MQVFAYKKTERGAQHILAKRLNEERAKREAAQRVAWDTQLELHARAARDVEIMRVERERIAELNRQERLVRSVPYRQTYANIERRVCKLFGLTKVSLHSRRRDRRVVFARQCAMYWACRLTRLSLPQIGRLMGGKDHTTILHGRDKYPEKRKAMGRNLRRVA
jgi:chromosomal replication initiation ATPase DnaA